MNNAVKKFREKAKLDGKRQLNLYVHESLIDEIKALAIKLEQKRLKKRKDNPET